MKNKKVTVIDQDKKVLRELKIILSAIGYAQVVITDARWAVHTSIWSKPDVIILELKMPRKNGFEIAYEINCVFDTPRVPIIAMSSHFRYNPSPLMNLCGINRYLRKPLRPLDVIWAIENAKEENEQMGKARYLESVGV